MRAVSVGPGALRGSATFGKDSRSRVVFSARHGGTAATIEEPKGRTQRFDVRFLLGRAQMEQPLVAADRGRLQALPVARDSTKHDWFDLFAGEERLAGEFGHWLGRGMNANSQCISCHATDYRPNYRNDDSSYESSWSEIGVGCEACHGAGAAHVADPKKPYGPFGGSAGIAIFRPRPGLVGAPTPAPPQAAAAMNDTCGTCHSVRRAIAENFRPGTPLLDTYEPVLLDEEDYWPTGLVHSEDYEWASFEQSKMAAKGVNCLACHEVHSGRLRATGDALCLGCHEKALASADHTRHRPGLRAPQCVSCHMPESTFMARDRRRDHSLSVPDPLAARETASPSACETCHADRGRDRLAMDAERLWPKLLEGDYATRRTVSVAFAQARAGKPESGPALRDCLAGRTCGSAVLRASAARLTTEFALDNSIAGALVEALEDKDALVRASAAFALADVDPREPMLRQWLTKASTSDPVRAVRINAAWALRTVETKRLPPEQAASIEKAWDEWRRSALVLADAPETWHAIGLFETARDRTAEAESAYRRAIAIESASVPSRFNLAMLLMTKGRTADARKELEALVAVHDGVAEAWFALGAIGAEDRDWTAAARSYGRCLQLDPDYPRALTELTSAYLEAGLPNLAVAVLNGALERPGKRVEAYAGLVQVAMRSGKKDEAVAAARALVGEDPSAAKDPKVRELLSTVAADKAAAAAD